MRGECCPCQSSSEGDDLFRWPLVSFDLDPVPLDPFGALPREASPNPEWAELEVLAVETNPDGGVVPVVVGRRTRAHRRRIFLCHGSGRPGCGTDTRLRLPSAA